MDELNVLQAKSDFFNSIVAITGLLVKLNSGYVQYIEGEKEKVDMLYNKLLNDDRHQYLVVLKKGYIEKRRFEKWGMLLKKVSFDEIKDIEKTRFSPTTLDNLQQESLSPSLNLALQLIRNFEALN